MKFSHEAAWDTQFKLAVYAGNRGYPEYDRVAVFEDLNPEVRFVHCMSRWDMFRLGLWLIGKAWKAEPSRD